MKEKRLIGGSCAGAVVRVYGWQRTYYAPRRISLEDWQGLSIDGVISWKHPEDVYERDAAGEFVFSHTVHYKPQEGAALAGDDAARKKFADQMESTFPEPTEEERYLIALAEEYHAKAEAYDRTVCTGPILDGAILPANAREIGLINRNSASLVRTLTERALSECGIERKAVIQAISQRCSAGSMFPRDSEAALE